jgi:flagellar protein FlbD
VIKVTRLDGSQLVVNSDLVETVEATPDTVVSLIDGRKMVVRETVDQVVDRFLEFRRKANACPYMIGGVGDTLAAMVAGSEKAQVRS